MVTRVRQQVRAGVYVGERTFERRNGVGEAFPARRAGRENGISAVADGFDRGGLVVVEPIDTVIGEDACEAGLDLDVSERRTPAGTLLVKLYLSVVVRPVAEPGDGIVYEYTTQPARRTVPVLHPPIVY